MIRRANAPHDNLRMLRWMRACIFGSGLASALSGVLWLLYHNYWMVEGEFGPVAHPLERTWLVVHGGAALAVAWVLGLIWMGHVRRGISFGRRLPSGIGLVVLVGFLMLSGWGLYYLGDARWRELTATAHWVVGLIVVALFALHSRRGSPPPPGGH